MAQRSEAILAQPGTADAMLPALARVRRSRRETRDVWSLELETESGARPHDFEAGQFNMMYAFGIGEVPISISGDPGAAGPLVHTIRAVGPVSSALCRLQRDDRLGLRGPFGSAWPVEAAKGSDVVVVAGGLGLAPLRPALYRILADRERYGKVMLLYGTRSPEDILFRRELEEWRRRLDVEIEITVDHAVGQWHGNVGVVTTLIERAGFDPLHSLAMVCGPEVMMRFAAAALEQAGVGRERIYVSLERNMKCAVGHCGHCQFGPFFLCKDGPVLRYDRVSGIFGLREI
jgi:NAD(P)H-flavin reductase